MLVARRSVASLGTAVFLDQAGLDPVLADGDHCRAYRLVRESVRVTVASEGIREVVRER